MPRRKHIEIDLDGLPKLLGAEVYAESSGFICVLREDIHNSVVGRGASVAEAITNWDSKLQAHLRTATDQDPVVIFVKRVLVKQPYVEEAMVDTILPKGNGKKPTWTDDNKPQHVIDFENQFYPSLPKKQNKKKTH